MKSMTSRVRSVAIAVIVLGLMLGSSRVLSARDRRAGITESSERLLYIRSPRLMRIFAMNFSAVAADSYWLRTIQHFGGDRLSRRRTGAFELLYPLLDLTTSLDPHFNAAYRFGAIFLAEPPPAGPGRPDQAIALLQKGLQAQPDRWEFAEDIGFVYYWWQRDYVKAADWFRRAADMPNAPNWMAGLAAVTLAQGGNRASSRVLWQEMLRNAEAEWIAAQARFRLAQLDALDQIEALERVVTTYTQRTGAPPRDWTDVIRAGLLRGIPVDPERYPYLLAPQRGRVQLDPTSPLNPLPVPEQSDPSTSLGTSPSTSLGTGR